MRLTHNFQIPLDSKILDLCAISKNLYNQALFTVRESLRVEGKALYYRDLDKLMKTTENREGQINYKLLKTQTSQQILRLLDKNIKSYVQAIKKYSKNKSGFKSAPKPPNYKKSKYNLLVYTNQNCQIKNGLLILSKDIKIQIPQFDKYGEKLKSFNQVRVIPKFNHIKIEIVYTTDELNPELNPNNKASIDLGMNNLATLVSNIHNPILFNGRPLKAYNQRFNKKLAKLNSIKDKQKLKTTKQIQILYENRNNYVKDFMHKTSRLIVNHLIRNQVSELVVGYNKGWKDSIQLGRKTNQKFVQIPYYQLIQYIKYKCEMCGIKFSTTEESYTSKCDSLALEGLHKQEVYKGQRIKRGLFQSSVGKLLNADVNGALNIMRKVVDDSFVRKIIDSGLLYRPIQIRNVFTSISVLKNFNRIEQF